MEIVTKTNHLGISATVRVVEGARPYKAQIGERTVAYKTSGAAFKAAFRYAEDQLKEAEAIQLAKG